MKLQKNKENNFKTVRGKQISYRGTVNTLTADVRAATKEVKTQWKVFYSMCGK